MADYEGDISVSVACSDTDAETTAFNGVLNESSTMAETISPRWAILQTLSEGITAAETFAALSTLVPILSEDITAAETIDDLSPVMVETVTAADTFPAVNYDIGAAITEQVAVRLKSMATANRVLSLYLYSKGKQTERHFYAQMEDGDVVEASSIPPTITTGAFGSNAFEGTGTGQIPASWSVYNDMLIYSNGVDQHQIYAGSNEYVRQFIVYHGTSSSPSIIGDFGVDATSNVTDGDSTTTAILDSIGSGEGNYGKLYIRTPVPANSFTFTVNYGNSSASVASIKYFNGAWTATSDFADSTASGGATLNASGTMSFTRPTDEISLYSFGNVGFWYCVEFSAALDSEVEISSVVYGTSWTSMHNMWDGVPTTPSDCWFYNASGGTWLNYGAADIDIGAMTSSDKLKILSSEKLMGIYIDVADTPNTNTGLTATVKYSCVDITGTVLKSVDDKIDASDCFTRSGWITFKKQDDITQEQFQDSSFYSYVYEITVSSTLSDDVVISVELMPYYDIDDLGVGVCSCQWKNRVAYSFDKFPQDVYISSSGNPMVLNGEDFLVKRTGDGRANRIVAMKQFYNEMLVFQEEKGSQGGCITLWDGYDPSTIGTLVLSTKLGTFSQKSATVVEGLFMNAEGTQTEKLICFFLSRYGVFMTDGKTIVCISNDVNIYFDPTSSDCIRAGCEAECWLDYDVTYRIIRIGLVTGSTAEVPNTFLWYDPFGPTGKRWGTDDLTYPLSCHAQIEAGSGQFPYLQVGGGCSDGYVYLLNYGTNDDGSAINGYVDHELDYHGFVEHLREIVLRVKTQTAGNVTITPYANGVAGTARNYSMVAVNANETTRRHRITDIKTEGNHIKVRYQNNTVDQSLYLLDCGYDLVVYEHR